MNPLRKEQEWDLTRRNWTLEPGWLQGLAGPLVGNTESGLKKILSTQKCNPGCPQRSLVLKEWAWPPWRSPCWGFREFLDLTVAADKPPPWLALHRMWTTATSRTSKKREETCRSRPNSPSAWGCISLASHHFSIAEVKLETDYFSYKMSKAQRTPLCGQPHIVLNATSPESLGRKGGSLAQEES